MPKRSAPPKPAVEVNPQFDNRPGVEVVEDRRTPHERGGAVEVFPGIAAVNSEELRKRLDDLDELLSNAQLASPSSLHAIAQDARQRVTGLRIALGL